jgi:hypothetical protein
VATIGGIAIGVGQARAARKNSDPDGTDEAAEWYEIVSIHHYGRAASVNHSISSHARDLIFLQDRLSQETKDALKCEDDSEKDLRSRGGMRRAHQDMLRKGEA